MIRFDLFFLLISFIFSHAMAQSEDSYPDEFAFLGLDQEAQVMNMAQVLKGIGYPVAILKTEKEVRVYCRVLVDEKGTYIRHSFTRLDHPALQGPISVHLPTMRFAPAIKNNQKVASWVNVPLVFEPEPQASVFRSVSILPRKRAQKAQWDFGVNMMKVMERAQATYNWQECIYLATTVIGTNQRKLRRSDPQLLAEAYRLRAFALLQQGLVEQAHFDLNDGLALVEGDHALEYHFRSMRLLTWMKLGTSGNFVTDLSYLKEEWMKQAAWDIWSELLESQALREALPLSNWTFDASEMPEDFQGIISGLAAMAAHDFGQALPWLEVAHTYSRPGTWRRELELRIAECLRQVDQYETALNQCQRVVEMAPLDPFPHFVKGIILMDIGAEEDGLASLTKALALGLDGHAKLHAATWIDQSSEQHITARDE